MRIEELGIYSNIFQFFILKSSSKMYQKKNFPLRGLRAGGLAPPNPPIPSATIKFGGKTLFSLQRGGRERMISM